MGPISKYWHKLFITSSINSILVHATDERQNLIPVQHICFNNNDHFNDSDNWRFCNSASMDKNSHESSFINKEEKAKGEDKEHSIRMPCPTSSCTSLPVFSRLRFPEEKEKQQAVKLVRPLSIRQCLLLSDISSLNPA